MLERGCSSSQSQRKAARLLLLCLSAALVSVFNPEASHIVPTETLELETSAFYSHVVVRGMLALIPLHIQKCALSWLNITDADYTTMGG